MDCLLRTPQIQLQEIANYILSATGSAFGMETLCRAVYRLGITRKKVIIENNYVAVYMHVSCECT